MLGLGNGRCAGRPRNGITRAGRLLAAVGTAWCLAAPTAGAQTPEPSREADGLLHASLTLENQEVHVAFSPGLRADGLAYRSLLSGTVGSRVRVGALTAHRALRLGTLAPDIAAIEAEIAAVVAARLAEAEVAEAEDAGEGAAGSIEEAAAGEEAGGADGEARQADNEDEDRPRKDQVPRSEIHVPPPVTIGVRSRAAGTGRRIIREAAADRRSGTLSLRDTDTISESPHRLHPRARMPQLRAEAPDMHVHCARVDPPRNLGLHVPRPFEKLPPALRPAAPFKKCLEKAEFSRGELQRLSVEGRTVCTHVDRQGACPQDSPSCLRSGLRDPAKDRLHAKGELPW